MKVRASILASAFAMALLAPGCGAVIEDSRDCGSRHLDCLGGACSAGTCGPVTLAKSSTIGSVMTIDDTRVYWMNQSGGVSMVSKSGGPVTSLGSIDLSGEVTSMASDGTNVYVATFGVRGAITRVASDGSGVTPIAERPFATAVQVDGDGCVLWASWNFGKSEGGVERLCPGADVPERLSSVAAPSSLALGADEVFFASDAPFMLLGWTRPCADPPGTLQRAGPTPTVLARGFPKIGNTALAHDGEALYWRDQCTGRVERLLDDSTTPTPLAAVGTLVPGSGHYPYDGHLVVDELGVYVVVDWSVVRLPKDGGPPVAIGAMPRGVRDMAVDATRLYALTGGAVVSVVKPR